MTMTPRTVPFIILPEPELSFGSAGPAPQLARDPQKGLLDHGPYSLRLGKPWHPNVVRLFPIASEDDWTVCIEAVKRLEDFERIPKVAAKLRADYPGFEQAFRT